MKKIASMLFAGIVLAALCGCSGGAGMHTPLGGFRAGGAVSKEGMGAHLMVNTPVGGFRVGGKTD